MHRDEKTQFIEDFSDRIGRARLAVIADYRGLKVNTLVTFRKGLTRTPGTEFRVVKNTLFRRVVEDTDFAGLGEFLTGPSAVFLAYDDAVESAKALKAFLKDNDKLEIKGGVLGGKTLSAAQIKALADLPPKEILQAMLLGVLNAPARNFVSLLANANRQIVNVLAAYRDKLQEEG